MSWPYRALAPAIFTVFCGSALADVPLSPGNLVVQADDTISEYDLTNTSVGTVAIPMPGDSGARDLVVDDLGRLHVFNGTFDPTLATFDRDSAGWSEQTALGWSNVNNLTYGGIAAFGRFVFVTDMRTFGDGGADEAQGVVRFDLASGTWERFAESFEPIDLNIGLDGKLYALYPGGSPEGRFIEVYDPLTLAFVELIELQPIFGFTGHRALAVDEQGTIYLADLDGDLAKFTREGEILAQTNLCVPNENCQLFDIDVAPDGRVAVSDRDGGITLTDTQFSAFDKFFAPADFDGAFVSFVPEYDDDSDGVPDVLDNCQFVQNAAQVDADSDGYGNRCDTDLDNDCVTNVIDLGILREGFFGTDPVLDFNVDGVVNVIDLGVMRAGFFGSPGPSGTTTACDAR